MPAHPTEREAQQAEIDRLSIIYSGHELDVRVTTLLLTWRNR